MTYVTRSDDIARVAPHEAAHNFVRRLRARHAMCDIDYVTNDLVAGGPHAIVPAAAFNGLEVHVVEALGRRAHDEPDGSAAARRLEELKAAGWTHASRPVRVEAGYFFDSHAGSGDVLDELAYNFAEMPNWMLSFCPFSGWPRPTVRMRLPPKRRLVASS
jgi:hypothetical protein